MGLDFHGLGFVRYAGRAGDLGATITIGRQELHVNAMVLRQIVQVEQDYVHQAYCEELLTRYFGASLVDSLDNSSFEHATQIHDMNALLPASLGERYDTVLDSGTLEHVYNIVQALNNCTKLCKPGGQIIHILPTNNYCGHGFWQFSPELFFSLYSEENGYRDTEVYVSDFNNKKLWYRIIPPSGGRRVNIYSSSALYVMARTFRKPQPHSHAHVQQSDYAYEWEHNVHDPQPQALPGGLRGRILQSALYEVMYPLYHKLKVAASVDRLSARNPGLHPVRIAEMIA